MIGWINLFQTDSIFLRDRIDGYYKGNDGDLKGNINFAGHCRLYQRRNWKARGKKILAGAAVYAWCRTGLDEKDQTIHAKAQNHSRTRWIPNMWPVTWGD